MILKSILMQAKKELTNSHCKLIKITNDKINYNT